MAQVALVGYSGHGLVVAELVRQLNHTLIGYFEPQEKQSNPFNLSYLGSELIEKDITPLLGKGCYYVLGTGINSIRRRVYYAMEKYSIEPMALFHPKSIMAPSATVGRGTLVLANTIINSFATVGNGCILNTGSIVEHDCVIGDFAHLAPGSVVTGNVKIGDGAFIGANATIKQGVTIGSGVIVGAGAVVLNDIPDGETWVGVPARKVK